MEPIYLDNNATTPILPAVAQAMHECQLRLGGNPASQHGPGRAARRLLEDAREGIGRIVGASLTGRQADRVIITSGGTEANNLALQGLGDLARPGIVVSAIEHPSVSAAAQGLALRGASLARLGVDARGVVQVDALPDLLTNDVRLVSVMLGNNETGVLQPVAELAPICRRRGAVLHTDAVQVVGKLLVDFAELSVDALTLAAHKFHGPCGVGALVVRGGVPLQAILGGGHQQEGARPGTEPVALAVGMHEALRIWHADQVRRTAHLGELRDRLEAGLRRAAPDLVVWGEGAPRLPHTLAVAFPGLDRQALVMALDLAGVAVATGSACASGSSQPSPTLRAMGVSEELIRGSIRLSVGAKNTLAEIDSAVARITGVFSDLRRQKERGKSPGAANAPASNSV
jgi:cysteine desulfurase